MINTASKITLLGFLFLFGIFAYTLQSPPQVKPVDAPVEEFSAERAFLHLQTVARAPHSGGTPEHTLVRNYITGYCESMGLQVEIQDTLAVDPGRNYTVTSNVKNIVATYPGTTNSTSILVVSHYDSQPNSLGASDDGAGVVAMLETIRALSERPQLENKVIFLFTDQEEAGLLGAEAFANLHPAMDDIKVVLNYESRGNSGVAHCFEVSDENGWIVKQFAQAGAHPIANSMAYEIYKLMPNDTDFTIFREHNLTGLNQANVDGYVNYHSMTDTPDNVDRGLIQHHGDNMLSMITHLGAADLTNTKSQDVNFFNPIGSWMVYYPAYLNIPFMIIALLLYIWNLGLAIKNKRSTLKKVILGAIAYLAFILFVTIIVTLLAKTLVLINPHFENFYSKNFYNINWYILSIVGLWLVVGGLLYSKLWVKIGGESLTLGAAALLILMMLGLYLSLPTATFVLYYPLIWFLIFHGVGLLKKEHSVWLSGLAPLAALGLWIPLSTTLFIVFSLELPQAGLIMLALLWGTLIPAFCQIENQSKSLVLVTGLFLLIVGLGWGQVKARYTPDQPLQTYLTYVLDQDQGEASWISTNSRKDTWSENYVNHPEKEPFKELYEGWQVWRGDSKPIEPALSEFLIHTDTVIGSERHLKIQIRPQRDVIGMEFRFTNETNLTKLQIDGREIPVVPKNLIVRAVDAELSLVMIAADRHVAFQFVERALGIPHDLLHEPLPPDHIFGPGSFSNAVFTTRKVVL